MFYVGLDISVARTAVCIMDAAGQATTSLLFKRIMKGARSFLSVRFGVARRLEQAR